MDKKEILSSAAAAVNQKKPNFFVRAWRRVKRSAAAFWRRLRALDAMAFFNILLLALVVAMLLVMLGSARRQSARKRDAERPAGQILIINGRASAVWTRRPTVVVSRNGMAMVERPAAANRRPARKSARNQISIAALPLKKKSVTVIRTVLPKSVMVDGRAARGAGLRPMTTINGDLYLQNMSKYTLPCGVRVNGNLFLRNVRLMKFCGGFEVKGNIYVSSNSSFGPIPRNAYLGGQVVF
jgi:hypothetical protein